MILSLSDSEEGRGKTGEEVKYEVKFLMILVLKEKIKQRFLRC